MAGQTRMSRDDFKKAKELEELRKSGVAPPAVDDDGKMINPHIPQYISNAPWYLNSTKPGLKHQYTKHFTSSDSKKFADIKTDYARGAQNKRKAGALKYQKGACKNCGATTHTDKECIDRPRQKNAKLQGTVLADNDVVQDLQFDYEGKRDRWRGYDPATYQRVIDQYERTEEERKAAKKRELDAEMTLKQEAKAERKKKRREEKHKQREMERAARKELKAKKRAERAERDAKRAAEDKGMGTAAAAAGGDQVPPADGPKKIDYDDESSDSDVAPTDSDSDSDSDTEDGPGNADAREMDDKGVMHQRLDTKNRTTVRNLRLREDTAKYLLNLNINSAHYDPKTRSMRDNPHPDKDPKDVAYAGDNFVRHSGDAKAITAAQRYVWDANEKGVEEINILSNPSQAEQMFQLFQAKKAKLKDARKTAVLDKYGGAEHLTSSADADSAEADLRLMQSEHYVEYSEDGRVLKGQEKAIPKTKYVEDVWENNHKSVWGSFYDMASGRWGYQCCHQTTRHAFCTGEAGKQAKSTAAADLESKKGMAFKPVVKSEPAGSGGGGGGGGGGASSAATATAVPAEGKDRKLAQAVGEGLVRSLHADAAGDAAYQDKLSKAIKAEKQRQRSTADDTTSLPVAGGKKGKPKYNAHYDTEAPTDAEMEAHRMMQMRADDPMAKFLKG